jgi:hypothetical protein
VPLPNYCLRAREQLSKVHSILKKKTSDERFTACA